MSSYMHKFSCNVPSIFLHLEAKPIVRISKNKTDVNHELLESILSDKVEDRGHGKPCVKRDIYEDSPDKCTSYYTKQQQKHGDGLDGILDDDTDGRHHDGNVGHGRTHISNHKQYDNRLSSHYPPQDIHNIDDIDGLLTDDSDGHHGGNAGHGRNLTTTHHQKEHDKISPDYTHNIRNMVYNVHLHEDVLNGVLTDDSYGHHGGQSGHGRDNNAPIESTYFPAKLKQNSELIDREHYSHTRKSNGGENKMMSADTNNGK